jgi:ketosteroid isomerase-like protein
MKNLKNISTFAVLAVAAMSAAHTDAKTVKAWVQGEMNKCAKAAMMRDIKGFSMHIKENFAPNCMYKTLDGKTITVDAWLEQVGGLFSMSTKVVKAEIKASDVKVKGNMAWATGTFSYDGWIMKDGKKAHLQVWETAGHTLMEKEGRWWVTSAVQKTAKWLLDGKPWMPSN